MGNNKKIFPGYVMVLVTAILMFWGAGIYTYSLGNYMNVLTEAFGWTRAEVSLAASFNAAAGGVQGAIVGVAVDKYGSRVISFIGFAMLGLGLCLIYFMDSLWMFYIFWLIAGLGYGMGTMSSLNRAIANWFIRRRGFMVSLSGIGMCVSGLAMTPFTMWLLIEYGWQNTFLMAGLVTLCLGLPLIWFFIKPHRPEYYGWLPDGAVVNMNTDTGSEAAIRAGVEYATSTEEVEFTVRQAMRDKSLWILCIATTLGIMPFLALTAHAVPYLTDMGIDPIIAATIIGSSVFMRFPTQLLFGVLADRVSKDKLRYLAMIGYAVTAVGLFILTRVTSTGLAWLYAVVFGLGMGGQMGIQAQIQGRYWGRKAFGSIGGIIAPFMLLSGIVAPVFTGWIHDTTGDYSSAFNTILVLLIVAVGVMYFAVPPKPPAKITKITEFL